jgi:hypothetical protein
LGPSTAIISAAVSVFRVVHAASPVKYQPCPWGDVDRRVDEVGDEVLDARDRSIYLAVCRLSGALLWRYKGEVDMVGAPQFVEVAWRGNW